MRIFGVVRKLNIFADHEAGVTLIETALALAILGAVAVTFLSGQATISRATIIADEKTTAESLARSQMEWSKNAEYVYSAGEYSPAPLPAGDDSGATRPGS